MTNKVNRGPAHLLQVVFQFPEEELDKVAAQIMGKEVIFNSLLNSVTPREERVLRMYYGIGHQPMTMKSIAEELSVPLSRIHDIRDKGLRKVKHPSRCCPAAAKLIELDCRFTGLEELAKQQVRLDKARQHRPIDLANELLGSDHAPTCLADAPCPTCRLRSLLEQAGLRKQFDDFLVEWLAPAKSDGDVHLTELDLSVRTSDALRCGGLLSLESIASQTEAELLRTPGLGRKRLNEVKEVLANYGRRLRE